MNNMNNRLLFNQQNSTYVIAVMSANASGKNGSKSERVE